MNVFSSLRGFFAVFSLNPGTSLPILLFDLPAFRSFISKPTYPSPFLILSFSSALLREVGLHRALRLTQTSTFTVLVLRCEPLTNPTDDAIAGFGFPFISL